MIWPENSEYQLNVEGLDSKSCQQRGENCSIGHENETLAAVTGL